MDKVSSNGASQQTPDNMILDAGAVYINPEYDSLTGEFTGERLGATSGGSSFNVEIEPRSPEIDGIKGNVKNLSFIDSHNATLTVNLKEQTTKNFRRAIGAADIDEEDEHFDIVTGRNFIKSEDYIDSIGLFAHRSSDRKLVAIILHNALSTEGFEAAFEDDNELILPITFTAHIDLSQGLEIDNVVPYEIYYPKPTLP